MSQPPASIPVDAPGARRIARNALAGFLRGGITVPLGLVITALVLDRLGPAALGLWSLMGTFTYPMVPLSFGIATSLVRQVALHRSDPEALTGYITTCFVLYSLILVALGGIYLAFAPSLHTWLAERSGIPLDQTRLAAHFTAISFLTILGTLTFTAALNGLEDFPSAQAAVTANYILLAALVLIFVTRDASITRLFQATTAAGLLQGSLQVLLLRQNLGFLPLSLAGVSRQKAGVLLREGANLFTLDAYRFSFYLVDKWVITAFLGSAATGYYELGSRLGTIFRGLLNTLASPLLAASAFASTSTMAGQKLERLTFYSLRYMFAAAVPLALFVAVRAEAILHVWVGQTGAEAMSAIQHMVPAYLLNAFTMASLFLVAGLGRTRDVVVASVAGMLFNLSLDLAAIRLGHTLTAVVRASLIASGLISFGLLVHQARSGTLPLRRLLQSLGAILLAGSIAVALVHTLSPAPGTLTRLESASRLLVQAIASALLYGTFLRVLGEVDDQDRYFITAAWRRSASPETPGPARTGE